MSLYLVATPIGNLDDMTLRALKVLREAEVILAEDTRRTQILLTHFEIAGKRLESYHQHNEHARTPRVIEQVKKGVVTALVTDAGMPSIADPGFLLVREALAAGIEPVIVPGVSAVTFSAAACGFPVNQFRFLGFPPVKSGRRLAFFQEIAACAMTSFFYEAPHRMEKLLRELSEVMPERRIALIREATKAHEEVIRGTAAELFAQYQTRPWKGEFTVGVCGLSKDEIDDPEPV